MENSTFLKFILTEASECGPKVKLSNFLITLLVLITLSGCNGEGGESAFDFAEEKITNGGETEKETLDPVDITSFSPEDGTIRVSDGVETTFVVSVNPGAGSDISYIWSLNSVPIAGQSRSFLKLDGSLTNEGTNSLEVVASNGETSDSKLFVLYKNTKPNINTTTPGGTGNSVTCGIGSDISFSVNASDVDNDVLSYTWKFNGVASHSSLSIVSGGADSEATLTPPCSMTGSNLVTVEVSDGYERVDYSWNVVIINPLTAQIVGYTPAISPVIIQESTTQTFTVSASGQAPYTFDWSINGNPAVTTNSVPSYEALASSFIQPNGIDKFGANTLKVTVTDDNGSTDDHTFNIKINSRPTISNPVPSSSDIIMNVNSTRAFSITASDLNGDALTYTWTLDGLAPPSGIFTGSGNSITFNPTASLLGDHTIKVSVYDGISTTDTTQTWNVNVNYFTQACNALETGEVCTIAGPAGLGGGIDPLEFPQTAKIRPYDVLNDGNDNFFILDTAQDVVWFYNRGAVDLNIVGTVVGAGKLAVVAGTGAYGAGTPGLPPTKYMLYEPRGIAWDPDRGDLYVSLRNWHRVMRFTSGGSSEHVICSGWTGNAESGHVEGASALSHACRYPVGIAFDERNGQKRLYVTSSDHDYVKYFDITSSDTTQWTGHNFICKKNGSGACTAGSANGTLGNNSQAQANNPHGLKVDKNGLVYVTHLGDNRVSIANPTDTTYSLYGGAITLAPNTSYRVGGSGSRNTLAVGSAHVAYNSMHLYYPQGVVPHYNGNDLIGFFVSSSDHDVVSYFNTSSSSITIGDMTIDPGMANHVFGTRSDGYNGNNQKATQTLLWVPLGMDLTSNGQYLVVAERDNYRVRTLDISVPDGDVGTMISGKEKADFSGGSNSPAPSVLMNRPTGIAVDTTNNRLLWTEISNCRVRSLNLKTGEENVVVGAGCGQSDTEDEDPGAVRMYNPRSVFYHNGGIFYTDFWTWGANRNSQVRVYNSNNSATNFFGTTVPAGKVASVAGNFGLGSQNWDSAFEGQAATSTPLKYPTDIVTDGTNLYIADTYSHCILKVDSNGLISRYAGACGSAGYANGSPVSSSSVRFRYPRQMAMDPLIPGNMFIADQIDRAPSRIRYVNASNETVQIADQIIAPNTITTLFDSDRGLGVAAYDNWICYTSGQADQGHLGNHNILCKDRSDIFGSTQFRIGPSGGADRAGIQSGTQEEGVFGPGVHLFAPYKLAFDASGNLYVTEYSAHVIRKIKKWW